MNFRIQRDVLFCLITFIWIFAQPNTLSGQSVDETIPGIPQSAPARPSANGSNGNNSAGVIVTSFPVANLQGKLISSPVSVNYTHGQGIRVSEISSIVGTGFDISYGGTITRELRGIPDENIHNPVDIICGSDTYTCNHISGNVFPVYYFLKRIDPIGQHYLYGWFDTYDFHRARINLTLNTSTCFIDSTFDWPRTYLDDLTIGQLVEEFKGSAPSCPTCTSCTNCPVITLTLWNKMKNHFIHNAELGAFDTEPDIFHFNVGTYSGSFVLNHAGNPILLENPDLIVQPAIGPASGSMTQWVIITPEGTRYIFENSDFYREQTSIVSQTGFPNKIPDYPDLHDNVPYPNSCKSDQDESVNTMEYYSKWHLSQVQAINGETINYEYFSSTKVINNPAIIQQDLIDVSELNPNTPGTDGFDCEVHPYNASDYIFNSRITDVSSVVTENNSKTIKSIQLRHQSELKGTINFIYSTSDNYYTYFQSGTSNFIEYKALKEILQYNSQNSLINRTELDYSVFSNGRLKLKGVKQYPLSTTSAPLETKFEYEESINLPADYNSSLQDKWGFYNYQLILQPGGTFLPLVNTNLIPSVTLQSSDYEFLTYCLLTDLEIPGADRSPDLDATKANILTQVTYPTGGVTNFEYELNDYFDATLNQNVLIGGLRIKKVRNFDGINSSPALETEYLYTANNSVNSSGEIAPERKHFDVQNYGDYLHDVNILGTHTTYFDFTGYSQAYKGLYLLRASFDNRPSSNDYIVYTRITQKNLPDNGSIVSEYTGFSDFPDENEKVSLTFTPFSFSSTNYFADKDNDPGVAGTDLSSKRGLLKNVKIYDKNNYIVKSTVYEYEFIDAVDELTAFKVKNDASFFMFMECNGPFTNKYPTNTTSYNYYNNYIHNVEYYKHRTRWHYIKSILSRTYDTGATNYLETTTEYFYDSPSKLVWTKHYDSDGKEYKTTNKYVTDFNFPSGALSAEVSCYKYLRDNHIISFPIEVSQAYKDGLIYKTTSASFTSMKQFNGPGTNPLPYKIYAIDLKIPVDDFVFTDIVLSGVSHVLTIDSRYRLLKTFEQFDKYGNLVCEYQEKGLSNSTIYGMDNTEPVARFVNAKVGFNKQQLETTLQMDGIDASYTGFEDEFIDGWYIPFANRSTNESYEGLKSLEFGYSYQEAGISKSFFPTKYQKKFKFGMRIKTSNGFLQNGGEIGLIAKKLNGDPYLPCYNTKTISTLEFGDTGGEWKYFEIELDGDQLIGYTGSSCSGSLTPITDFQIYAYVINNDDYITNNSGTDHFVYVDDLRFLPEDAQLQTFQYDPLTKQPISSYDTNFDPIGFVDYDEFGRKKWVLDKFKSVLQYFEYHYFDPNIPGDHNTVTVYNVTKPHTQVGFLDSLNTNLLSLQDFSKSTQYADGLSRPLQIVQSNQAPMVGNVSNDLVSFVKYDDLGRTPVSFLPYIDNTSNGSFKSGVEQKQLDFYANVDFVAHDDFPFSESVYDGSPLNRTIEKGAPGAVWQVGNGHTVTSTLKFNSSNEVLKWVPGLEGTGAVATTYFGENQLYEQEIIDENGHKTTSFTDKLGRLILKQSEIATFEDINGNPITTDFTQGTSARTTQYDLVAPTLYSTYYVYNEMGQVAYIIPPIALQKMNGIYDFDESDAIFEDYLFASRFDIKGRGFMNKKPGTGWEYFIYDLLNRPVLTQSANQHSNNEWNFVKYDVLGRSIMTGLFNSTLSQQNLQSSIDAWLVDNWERRSSAIGNLKEYSNEAFPILDLSANDDVILTVQYYDDYNFNIHNRNFVPFGSSRKRENVKGLPTGTLVKILNTQPDDYLLTVQYYDNKYRPIQSHVQNHLSGWDVNNVIFDFSSQILQTIRFHYANNVAIPTIIRSRYTYDHRGRLIYEYLSIGTGILGPEKLVGNYEYNAMSQVIRKNLDYSVAQSDFLQQMDYRYNIRGWLSSINNAELVNDGSKNLDGNDIFGEELYYENTGAFTIDNTQTDPFVATNQFNGNVSAIRWKSRHPELAASQKAENLYAYRYDDANQFTAAYFAKSTIGTPGVYDANFHAFDEKLSYDMSGNITNLARKSETALMDDVNYEYSGNKLLSATDIITQNIENGFHDGNTSGNDFSYDNSGNLISDLNKNISIQYNHLNLPTEVTNGTNDLTYLYDATGTKLKKTDPDGTVHDYVGGIEYLNSDLLFVNFSAGRINKTGPQTACSSNFDLDYFIQDHLGNIRAIITREENAPEHGYLATMEPGNLSTEDQLFYNVSTTKATSPSALATSTSSYASLLNVTSNNIGPAKMLYVQEGDKISVDVKSYFNTFTGSNNTLDVNDILAQLANLFILNGNPNPTLFESSMAAGTFTSNSNVNALLSGVLGPMATNDAVLGYLAYLTFDTDFNLIEDASGILPVSTDNSVEDLALLDLVIPKNGYIYIYVANESPTDVYFDNLHIIHKKSNVLETNDYFPYGLLNTKSSTTSFSMDPLNTHKYQDKEQIDALGLNTLDFGLRHYDATLCRWQVQDPMMQFMNPYIAMSNNPVITIDPTGGSGYATSQSAPHKIQELENFYGGGGSGAGFGGMMGQWASMTPGDRALYQMAHGSAIQSQMNAVGQMAMEQVHIETGADGTVFIVGSNGNYLSSSNSNTHPIIDGKAYGLAIDWYLAPSSNTDIKSSLAEGNEIVSEMKFVLIETHESGFNYNEIAFGLGLFAPVSKIAKQTLNEPAKFAVRQTASTLQAEAEGIKVIRSIGAITKYAGWAGTGISIFIAGEYIAQDPRSMEGYARASVTIGSLLLGNIPYVGIGITFGIGIADYAGAFNDYYNWAGQYRIGPK